jgi:small subunit ribosomal protein S6
MPANVYECMFLLDTNKVAGDVPALVKQLHGILERNQAEVLVSRPWDDRRLAYPIKGHKKGLFYLTYFRTDGKNLANLEHDFKLNETILRALILRVEPKLVEKVLQVAQGDGPVYTITAQDSGGDDDGTGRPEGDRRERRDRGDRGDRGERRGAPVGAGAGGGEEKPG